MGFLILCVAKESEHKDKKEEPAQRHPVERILKLGSQVCLAVSSFIGVGVVAQLLIKKKTEQAQGWLRSMIDASTGCTYLARVSLSLPFFLGKMKKEEPEE